MKDLIREAIKIGILLLSILWVVIVITDPSPARALQKKIDRIYEEKGSIHKELTREERDEYMEYLRILNDISNDSIYLIEIP